MPEVKSTTELTEEQKHFYQLLRIRATSDALGQPYIAYAIFKLIPVNAPGLGTMGVDEHYRVYIDFDFMMDKGIEYASQVLNHEPWHLLRNHNARGKEAGATGQQWNIVGDIEINDDIADKVPENCLFPSTFDLPNNQTAEWYLEQLKKKAEENQKNKDKQKGKGEKSDEQGQSSEPQQGEGSGDPSTGAGVDPNNLDDIFGTPNEVCGSSSEKLDDYKLGEGEAESVSEFEQEMIAREVAQQAKDYAQRKPGSVPANIKLWAEEKLSPTPTPWQKVLRGAIRSSMDTRGQTDYVRTRPNRKQPVKGFILPAMRSPKPRVAIGVDTSGSHVPMLPRVLDEVNTIVKKVGIRGNELRVFSIDTRLAGKVQYVNDARKVDLTGGGGTDMMPAFDWAKANKKDTDIFVLMTDGEVPRYPKEAPTNAVKFVVCILHPEGSKYGEQSFDRAVAEIGHWAKVVQIVVPNE